MELTIAIHREDGGYWAQVTKSEDPYLEGVSTAVIDLDELPACFEEALQMVLDDPALTLVIPRLEVGFVPATLTRGVEPPERRSAPLSPQRQ